MPSTVTGSDTSTAWTIRCCRWSSAGATLILLLVFAERMLRLNRANSRLQCLVKELSQVDERERRRLAGELHDSPMQKRALTQLQFSAANFSGYRHGSRAVRHPICRLSAGDRLRDRGAAEKPETRLKSRAGSP